MWHRQSRGMISGFWRANKGTWKTLEMEQCNCVKHANEIEEGSWINKKKVSKPKNRGDGKRAGSSLQAEKNDILAWKNHQKQATEVATAEFVKGI